MKMRMVAVILAVGSVLLLPAVASTADDVKGTPYAQLSSSMSQQPDVTTPVLVTMDSNDSISGIIHDTKSKAAEVIVKEDGVYFVVAAAQMGKESGDGDDYVDLWLRQNGKDVDNSNCRQAVKDPKFTTVLVSQGIAECKANDVLSVAIAVSSTGKGLGIIATKPKGEPVIPSIIFSMYKIR